MTTAFAIQDGYFERYVDRRGSGDELYLDERFRSRSILDELRGIDTFADSGLDEEQFDDAPSH